MINFNFLFMKSLSSKLFLLFSILILFRFFTNKFFKKTTSGQLYLNRKEIEKLKVQILEIKDRLIPLINHIKSIIDDNFLSNVDKDFPSIRNDHRSDFNPSGQTNVMIDSSSQDVVTKKQEDKNDHNTKLSVRQKKILDYMENSKRVDMSEIVRLIPDVSERTLRRDMDVLENLNKVRQIGKTRDSYYELIK